MKSYLFPYLFYFQSFIKVLKKNIVKYFFYLNLIK